MNHRILLLKRNWGKIALFILIISLIITGIIIMTNNMTSKDFLSITKKEADDSDFATLLEIEDVSEKEKVDKVSLYLYSGNNKDTENLNTNKVYNLNPDTDIIYLGTLEKEKGAGLWSVKENKGYNTGSVDSIPSENQYKLIINKDNNWELSVNKSFLDEIAKKNNLDNFKSFTVLADPISNEESLMSKNKEKLSFTSSKIKNYKLGEHYFSLDSHTLKMNISPEQNGLVQLWKANKYNLNLIDRREFNNGQIEFSDLAPGEYVSNISVDNYVDDYREFTLEDDKEISMDLKQANNKITFNVKDNKGNPIKNALIVLDYGIPLTVQQTDSKGQASFGLEKESYNYQVSKEGFSEILGEFDVSKQENIEVQLDQKTKKDYKVNFIVENQQEEPIPGAIVDVNGIKEKPTNSKGEVNFKLPAGEYKYSVKKPRKTEIEDKELTVNENSTLNLKLADITHKIEFIIANEEIKSSYLEIGLFKKDEDGNFHVFKNKTLEEDEKITFEVPEGYYNYAVKSPGYYKISDTLKTINKNKEKELTLEEKNNLDSFKVEFKVVDSDSNPLPNATVELGDESKQTNESGEIVFESVLEGYENYKVTHEEMDETETGKALITENLNIDVEF